MKELLFSTESAGWYDAMGGDQNPERAFSFLKECGYDGVDFDLGMQIPTQNIRKGQVHGFYDADVETLLGYYKPIKAAADKCGIVFAQAHGPFPLWVEEFPDNYEYLITVVEKMCAICQLLQCPILVVHPVNIPGRQEEFRRNLEMYRRLIPAAKEYGVQICLENMFITKNGHKIAAACSNMEEVCRYIDILNEEAGGPVFGFCYDVGHANLVCNDILEDLRTLGSRLTALHIHGNDGGKDLHAIPFLVRTTKKELSLDWESFLQGLREIGYRGTLNLESAGSLSCIPKELIQPMLQFGAAVCDYFRQRILE